MTLPEYLYYLGYTVKKHFALRNRKRLPCPVVSIGNVTLGGTGKTPAAMAVAREALAREFYPCILSRGYKGAAKGPCFVTRGEGPLIDPHQAGDETFLMAQTLRGVPIVKGADRYEAGLFALEHLPNVDGRLRSRLLFILDDGFQHWKLHRDIDVVLVRGRQPFGNGKLFPAGPLREPLSAMERADIVVLTNASDAATSAEGLPSDVVGELARYAPSARFYRARHRPLSFVTSAGETVPLSEVQGRRVLAFCGIANPASFRETLKSLAIECAEFIVFRDHHWYRRADVARILKRSRETGTSWIVTTEKDIMRLEGFGLPDIVALRIVFDTDRAFYNDVFGRLQKREVPFVMERA